MAKVTHQFGALGDILFYCSNTSQEIKLLTHKNFKHSGGADIATHARHMNAPLPEFTGRQLDTITFDMMVSARLGQNPRDIEDRITVYERTGRALYLTIGEDSIGDNMWLITKHSVTDLYYDGAGTLTDAEINISLIEYPKR